MSADPVFLALGSGTLDQLRDPQFYHSYAYGRNNPYKMIDPDGMAFWDVVNTLNRTFDTAYNTITFGGLDVTRDMATNGVTASGLARVTGGIIAGTAITAVSALDVGVAAGGVALDVGLISTRQTTVQGTVAAEASVIRSTNGNTLSPGRYANESIPARSSVQRFTASERNKINSIGQTSGCHTCGAASPGTRTNNWIPDHQPVSSLNINNAPQRLFPHCVSCSRTQGGEAARALRAIKNLLR